MNDRGGRLSLFLKELTLQLEKVIFIFIPRRSFDVLINVHGWLLDTLPSRRNGHKRQVNTNKQQHVRFPRWERIRDRGDTCSLRVCGVGRSSNLESSKT